MANDKKEVAELLANLPPKSSLEDIQYHLFVIQKVRNGLRDLAEKKVASHNAAEKRMSKWLKK